MGINVFLYAIFVIEDLTCFVGVNRRLFGMQDFFVPGLFVFFFFSKITYSFENHMLLPLKYRFVDFFCNGSKYIVLK